MRGEPVSRILSTPDRDPGLDDHSSANRVATAVKLPTRASRALASLRVVSLSGPAPREAPIWHCSGWGLPCRPCCQVRGGLLPHRFTITPASRGRLFSVALSLGLPPPGVTRHPCQRESGLSSDLATRGHPALRARGELGVPRACVNRKAPQARRKRAIRVVQRAVRPGAKAQPEGGQQRVRGGIGKSEGAQVRLEVAGPVRAGPVRVGPDRQPLQRQSKRAPGSDLRSGAMSLWPITAAGGSA